MGHKCFISFKTEDERFKLYIQQYLNIDMIDKSLNEAINSYDEDYIMRKIRSDYLSDSTVTLFLIGKHSAEVFGEYEQRYIKRELQASLYNGMNNSRNGILGIVLPDMVDRVYKGENYCNTCNGTHNIVDISDNTVIKEFSYNYYIPNNKCCYLDDDRYCVLVKWEDFILNPELYIDQAYDKRSSVISQKIKVYPNK